MKTITIPDELYGQLIELANEYCTQNNRHTADPLVFTIQEPDRIWGMDSGYSDGYEWIDDEGDTITDLKQAVIEYCEDNEVELPCEDLEDLETYHEDWLCEHLSLHAVRFRDTFKYKNHFLTAKACDEHIKSNYYKYHKDARSYAEHAFRNPDMKTISKLLRTLHESENS